jgi:hypothetical protein
MSDVESRRKALAAEAEVYRQTLKLEIQNIKLYARQNRRRYTAIRPSNPLFAAAAPVLAALLRRTRPVKKLNMLSKILIGWQMFSRFAPFIPGVITAIRGRAQTRRPFRDEQRTPAATI